MAETWLQAIVAQTQVFTLALLVVALIRLPMRRAFGAQAAYLAWGLVPVLCVAAWLPVPQDFAAARVLSLGLVQALPAQVSSAESAAAGDAPGWVAVLLGLWLGGVLAVVLGLVQGHARLRQSLTRVPGEVALRLPAGHSPALVGLWRPRLALPADFCARFAAAERSAILRHEAAHETRHDNHWSLLAQALLAVFWFHPLSWWALRRHRADQELACDAAVLASDSPPAVFDYAQALLKAQHAGAAMGDFRSASNWRSTHPLIERIAMLKSPRLSSQRRRAGLGLVAVLLLGALAAGPLLHAAPPAASQPQHVMLYLTLEQDGKLLSKPRLFGGLGQAMSLRWQTEAGAGWPERWELHLNTALLAEGRLQFDTRLSRGEPLQTMVQPRLIAAVGEPARIEVRSEDGRHTLGITVVGRLADQPDMRRTP
jgi:beta-lactamase regulating signal transducer with metallopeptidase domain